MMLSISTGPYESGVHRTLKNIYFHYVKEGIEEAKIKVHGKKYRIDVLDKKKNIAYEIQRHNFGKSFYNKVEALSDVMKVIIVHPIVIKQKITRMNNGDILNVSYINREKQAGFFSIFERLVHFRIPFIPEKMGFDLLLIREHIWKEFSGNWSKNKSRKYKMIHRDLRRIESIKKIRTNEDWEGFLPETLSEQFSNKDLADKLKIYGNNKRK
ncbi:MAG: hypothetical protein ACTSWY_13940, partial [Promethearchaeota archaeon]